MNYRQVNWTKERRGEHELTQKGLCAICLSRAKLVMDWSQNTGCSRGLLCYVCRSVLRNMNDDATLLRRAADYLESHRQACGRNDCRACDPSKGARPPSDAELRAGIAMAVSGGQICSADDIAKTAGLPRSRVRKMVTKLLASGDMIRGWNGILAFVGAVHE